MEPVRDGQGGAGDGGEGIVKNLHVVFGELHRAFQRVGVRGGGERAIHSRGDGGAQAAGGGDGAVTRMEERCGGFDTRSYGPGCDAQASELRLGNEVKGQAGSTPASSEPITGEQLDWAVRFACHNTEHAEQRWAERRAFGLIDDELRAALDYELGLGGGYYSRDLPQVEYQGGADPRVGIRVGYGGEWRTMHGQELLRRVRRVLSIGYPVPVGQLVMPL